MGAGGLVALLLAAAGCGARPAPPAVTGTEVEAARQSIAVAPPPAAQPRSAEQDRAMLAAVAQRVAAAAEPVCAAYLNRGCGFVVRLDSSDIGSRLGAWHAGRDAHRRHGAAGGDGG